MNLNDFAIKFANMSRDFPRRADSHFVKQVKAVHKEIVLATPVDTGFARSNWRVGIGRVPSGTIPAHAPGSKLGISEAGNAAVAIYDAANVLAKYKNGQEVFISNNVNYIALLNAGSSSQAGAYFIERAIAAGMASVRGGNIFVQEVRS